MFAFIHTLWGYHYWAQHKLWDCVQTIAEEDFIQPIAYSNGSVHVQIVHTMFAEAVWYERLHDGPRPTFTAKDYPTRSAIREKWDHIENQWHRYLDDLTADELNRNIVVRPVVNGTPYTVSVLDVLFHVVNHGTNHRAQILQIIHGYGGETYEHDFLPFYYRQRENSSTN